MRPAAAAIAAALATVLLIPTLSLALTPDQYEAFDYAIEEAFLNMGMTPGDMRIRHDYAAPDKFRLTLVDSLMRNPASLLEQVDRLARKAEHSAVMFGLYATMWDAMDVEPAAAVESDRAQSVRDVAGRLGHLPGDMKIHLRRYIGNLGRMSHSLALARERVGDHVEFLETEASALVTPVGRTISIVGI